MDEIYVRKRGKSRKIKKKYKILSTVILIIIAVLLIRRYINVKLDPLVCDLAEPQVIGIINKIISETVSDIMLSEKYAGRECITAQYSQDGKIKSLKADTALINLMCSDVAARTIDGLWELEEYNLYISLSNLFDDEVFWARFPALKMSAGVTPSGGVQTEITSVCESSGINQTHYSIFINVKATVHAQMLISTMEIDSETRVCIAEYVIVGDVPQLYLGDLMTPS